MSTLTVPLPQSSRSLAATVADVELSQLRDRFEAATGLPFDIVDGTTGRLLLDDEREHLHDLPQIVLDALARIGDVGVLPGRDGVTHYAIRLDAKRGTPRFAVGYVFSRPGVRCDRITARAAAEGWSPERIDARIAQHPVCSREVLENLLGLVVASEKSRVERALLVEEVETLGMQIQQTYEEISLLHMVTRNLHISRTPGDIAEMCLDRVHLLVGAAGTAIWLEESGGSRFRVKGDVPFDEIGMAHLIARFDDHDWKRPLVRNHVDRTLLGVAEPELQSLVIVPIAEGANRSGWIVSTNLHAGREYGTAEASLLGSVATILGTHTRNINLYEELEQLLVSFVHSLVSTLDAKDPYTRGHSERVALIARRLGEELGLPQKELDDLHLCGVLHDIGKIGVDDRILQKPDRLTDDEFDQIKQHPTIGYNILLGLKNLRHILPGVRNHHEAWDGSGYPDGLVGEEIPLMARILAVADSYDAMGSDRPYRKGMPLEKMEAIFRDGRGRQWDSRIIDAYFEVRDDIRGLTDRYSTADSGILRLGDPGETPPPA